MISDSLYKKYYPDNSKDGTLKFYSWLRSCVRPESTLVNIGAGLTSGDKIRSLRGEVRKVIGLDVDPAVMGNKDLDEAYVLDGKFPLPDSSVDAAWSDYVLEHVERPEIFLGEVYRILKPGGSYYFRTPNIFNYVSLISRFTPHVVHSLLANRTRAISKEGHEPYKTYYRLNSRRSLVVRAKGVGFSKIEIEYVECQPSYLMFHAIPFLLGVLHERIVNSCECFGFFRANMFGRFEK